MRSQPSLVESGVKRSLVYRAVLSRPECRPRCRFRAIHLVCDECCRGDFDAAVIALRCSKAA